MKSLASPRKPLTLWLLVCLALYCAIARAANEHGTSNSGDAPSSSASATSLHHNAAHTTREERIFANADDLRLPEVQASTATFQQRYNAFTRLGHRLVEHGRDPGTLRVIPPPSNTDFPHLRLLRAWLQLAKDNKDVVFLDASPDRQGRILAVPYSRNSDQELGRKSWVLLQVHPARSNVPPRVEWYVYVSHLEPDEMELAQRLVKSSDVKSLHHFLTHPL